MGKIGQRSSISMTIYRLIRIPTLRIGNPRITLFRRTGSTLMGAKRLALSVLRAPYPPLLYQETLLTHALRSPHPYPHPPPLHHLTSLFLTPSEPATAVTLKVTSPPPPALSHHIEPSPTGLALQDAMDFFHNRTICEMSLVAHSFSQSHSFYPCLVSLILSYSSELPPPHLSNNKRNEG